jgi:hypothetical protein
MPAIRDAVMTGSPWRSAVGRQRPGAVLRVQRDGIGSGIGPIAPISTACPSGAPLGARRPDHPISLIVSSATTTAEGGLIPHVAGLSASFS